MYIYCIAMAKLSKNVKALGVVSLLNDASSDMVYPLIPIFLTKTLGASYATVGLIEGIAESTASLLKVFSGWLSDRLRKRKLLIVFGYTLSAVSKPLLAFAQIPLHVLFVRFSDRIGKGLRTAPRDALIAESTDARSLGFAYGFHKAMDTLGATLGPVLAVIILPVLNNNLRTLFLLSFVASALAVLTLIFGVKETTDGAHRPVLPQLSLKLVPGPYRLFLFGIAVFAIANFSDAFLFLRAQEVGVATVLVPVLYALSNIFFAAFAAPIGKIADAIPPHKIMIAGYLVFALTHLGFAYAASPLTMWVLFPMFGLFSAMTDSIQKTITVHSAEPGVRGTLLGLMHTIIGICTFPASVIAGIVSEKFGAGAPFILSSMLAVVAAVILAYAFYSAKKSLASA